MLGINSKSRQEVVFCCLLTVRICLSSSCWTCRRGTIFVQDIDIIPGRCKCCSNSAMNKMAGETESRQRAGIIYLNKEPTQGFSQHKGERRVRFRGRCEETRGGGNGTQPRPWLARFYHHEKHEAKGREAQWVTGPCLPWAAAGHPISREAPSAERLRAGCSAPNCRGSHGCTQPFRISLPPCHTHAAVQSHSHVLTATVRLPLLTGFEIQMKFPQVV